MASLRLGYSYRLTQYAFGLGVLALLLGSGLVFFLNLVSLRAEHYQSQFVSRLKHATPNDEVATEQAPDAVSEPPTETEGEAPQATSATPTPAASPAPVAAPKSPSLVKLAALQTVRMMRPMAFYLVLTGGALAFLRGPRRAEPSLAFAGEEHDFDLVPVEGATGPATGRSSPDMFHT